METNKILKYLKGSATPIEEKELEDWVISSEENAKVFAFVKAQYLVSTFNETDQSANTEDAVNWYRKKIKESFKSSIKSSWGFPLKCAAMIVIFFGSAYLFYMGDFKPKSHNTIPKDAIILQCENGKTKIIRENGDTRLLDSKGNILGTQSGNKLHYNKSATTKKLIYNTLTVPYGKQFDIVLSDNTHVILNAGTSLKYPVNFIKGQRREVFLTGEAFFEVAKDKEHPFVVNSKGLNIRVLGTKFNVSAYPESLSTNTVLVEGAVGLYQENSYESENVVLMSPGQLASLDRTTKNLTLEKVDVSIYTSWMQGAVVFKHETFGNIIKKLERQYNVEIQNNNKELHDVFFTASFDKVPLELILQTFHENYGIVYTIENNKIKIN